jgi:MYXO-CTERM domain-containing protein
MIEAGPKSRDLAYNDVAMVSSMKLQLVFAAVLAAIPAARAYAGASCSDACSGPVGQLACGSVGLGCSSESGQCIICENNDHCQPGGTCADGTCIGLPCSPDAGTPPTGDAGLIDVGGGEGDASQPGEDAESGDALASSDASAGDAGRFDAGGFRDASTSTVPVPTVGAGRTDRSGCTCSATEAGTGSLAFIALAVFALFLRRRR